MARTAHHTRHHQIHHRQHAVHHVRHHFAHHRKADTRNAANMRSAGFFTTADTDQGRVFRANASVNADIERPQSRRASRAHYAAERRRQARAAYAAVEPAAASSSSFSGSSLVASARRYLGTNPTGRRSLWCGAFMDKILRDSGYPGGGNLALGYLHYGHRVSGPQVGAIAVMGRRRGGHVGVVTGVDANGNPIIVSGNHNRTVAESVYPRGRIIGYVMPGG